MERVCCRGYAGAETIKFYSSAPGSEKAHGKIVIIQIEGIFMSFRAFSLDFNMN
jgi:hypothetical protein